MSAASSPFLPMSPGVRWALIVYYICYHAVWPGIAAFVNGDTGSLVSLRVPLQFVLSTLVVMPLLFYRRDYGWLHPLILPFLFGVMKDVLKYPFHLILPFSVPLESFSAGTTSMAYSLAMGADALEVVRVGYTLTLILALCCYYAGYFYMPRITVPSLKISAPRNLQIACFTGVLLCIAVASTLIVSAGGLSAYLIAMRGGRVAMLEGLGQFITIGEFSFVIVLLWFVYEKRPLLNPAWLVAFLGAALTTLVVGGSRSALAYSLITMLFLWWHKRGRVSVTPVIAFGLAAVIVFSVFGSLRQDFGSDRIDYSVFSVAGLTGSVEAAAAEIVRRGAEESDLAAFAGALDKGLLWGRTYLGATAFWVPRAIWRGKPRSADSYNMWINFQGRSVDQPLSSGTLWGIPVGPVMEAFWNFHVVGVVIIFLFYGQFHRWLADCVSKYPNQPTVLLPVTIILTQFVATSLTFSTVVRAIFLLFVMYWFLGVWELFRQPIRTARSSYVRK